MSFDARYSSYKWRVTRRYIKSRDQNICQLKLDGCTIVATDVDHRVEPGPPSLGRDDLFYSVDNLKPRVATATSRKETNIAPPSHAKPNSARPHHAIGDGGEETGVARELANGLCRCRESAPRNDGFLRRAT
jgi:hypothetical protein